MQPAKNIYQPLLDLHEGMVFRCEISEICPKAEVFQGVEEKKSQENTEGKQRYPAANDLFSNSVFGFHSVSPEKSLILTSFGQDVRGSGDVFFLTIFITS